MHWSRQIVTYQTVERTRQARGIVVYSFKNGFMSLDLTVEFLIQSSRISVSIETQPTIGVEIDRVSFNRQHMTLREVGSSMAPTWPSYYPSCQCLMFVIDVSNVTQLGHSSTALHRALLALPATVPVVVVFNKCDRPQSVSRALVHETLMLNQLNRKGSVQVVDHVSATDSSSMHPLIAALQAAVKQVE
jgi:GTPase SAR1 family protein